MSACQSLPVPDAATRWYDDPSYFSERSKQVNKQASWRYSAKVGVTTPDIKEQANLIWEFRDQVNHVRLFGPLGVGAIKLEFDDYGVVLSESSGVQHRGKTAEALLTKFVGWPIPIDALSSWMFVLPAEGSAFRYTLDEVQQVKLLEQLGWRIEYSSYKQYGSRLMPRKIVATKSIAESSIRIGAENRSPNQVIVKLITKSWQ